MNPTRRKIYSHMWTPCKARRCSYKIRSAEKQLLFGRAPAMLTTKKFRKFGNEQEPTGMNQETFMAIESKL